MTVNYSIQEVDISILSSKPTGSIKIESILPNTSTITHLYSKYPTKLMCPNSSSNLLTKTCYILGYGGGLLQGDQTHFEAKILPNCNLILLTQGTTKIFCNPKQLPSIQSTLVTVDSNSSCLFLPDPIICFKNSIYHQNQKFYLKNSSNLVLLDWLGSGRKECGEIWKLESYHSKTEIYVNEELMARDITTLTNHDHQLNERMNHHHVIANLFIIGDKFIDLIDEVTNQFKKLKINHKISNNQLIWSVTKLEDFESGIIIRASANQVDHLRIFFRQMLQPLNDLVECDKLFN